MTLLHQIQTKLQTKKIADIVQELGYKPSKSTNVTKVLNELQQAHNITYYLDKSYYDFKYNPRTLLQAICRVLGISKIDYYVTIEAYEDNKRRLQALKNPYIFVDTNFKRKGQTIIALSFLESKRRIKLDKESLSLKSEEEIKTQISYTIKLHYKWKNGVLPLWGEIRAYLYYDINGKRTVYSVLGDIIEEDIIEEDNIQESRATVTLKNKTLIGI